MSPTKEMDNNSKQEHELMGALGISLSGCVGGDNQDKSQQLSDGGAPELLDIDEDTGYEIMSDTNHHAEAVDWTDIKAGANGGGGAAAAGGKNDPAGAKDPLADSDLDALEELVPDLKNRRRSNDGNSPNSADCDPPIGPEGADYEVPVDSGVADGKLQKRMSMESSASSTFVRNITAVPTAGPAEMNRVDSMRVQPSKDYEDSKPSVKETMTPVNERGEASSSDDDETGSDMYDGLDGNESDAPAPGTPAVEVPAKIPKEFINISSGQSLATATQTHEVRMPMYLPTFKPATGCTNASDFIVRCFVARLRSGITVVKHGRSRWCKSRLRILHIHPDGCSLSWKPAEGEPTSNRRPPKLDLTQCLEVRHAWSPDPQNPMYTGTPILRQKCEAANAHKSFALIFPKRTVDITAVTADQCKVLMEGFSALCFRLQVADLAGKGANKKTAGARGMPEEDGVSTTASVTLTNSSTPRGR